MNRGHVYPVISLAVLMILFSTIAQARSIGGMDFPETISAGGKTLHLNGAGFRTKLVIKVYAAGLYLEKPTKSAAEAISSEQGKQVHMQFIYKQVRADQLVEAWNDGFKANAGDVSPAVRTKLEQFNRLFTEPLKKGETMTFTYLPGIGTEVKIKGQVKGTIEGVDFMQALFSVWLGPKPPNKGLKEGMLGD